jgi:DNA-binding SARP family transcriptional activator/RecA/RadA recombinase
VNTRVPIRLEAHAPLRLRVGSSVTMISRWGEDCELRGKAAVVLATAALEGHADRQRISAMLWPTSEGGQARSNLRVLTHRINQKFGSELLVGSEHLALACLQVQIELLDVEAVLAALEGGGPARCELLADAGLESEAGEELQSWLAGARQRLKRGQMKRLNEALDQALAADLHERALALARACVQLDPLSEHQHRRLMEILVRGGDRAAALAAYEECKVMVRQHLGVLPGPETRGVQLRILQEQALGPAQGGHASAHAGGLTSLRVASRYPLVERQAVLASARAALEQGVHVVVQGEPGLGKTRLALHLVAAAGDAAESVAVRSALKNEPYAAIAQLLQEVQPRRAARIGVPEQIELARLAPLAFSGVQPSQAALSAPRLHAALRHWWARLGDAGVRLLLLDDVQYADAASQAALAALLDKAPDAAARAPALLLTNRSGEIEAVLEDALTDAQARRRAHRVQLQRLTPAGVRALLASMAAAQHLQEPAGLAQQLHKRTAGNPLFVIELAQQVLEQGDVADTASVQALLVSRLQRCDAAAQQLAAVAAVASDDFTVELAAAVTGQTALGLMPAWNELQQRGLFAGQGLAHDLVREAVLARLPQAILQQLHRQIAQFLERQGLQGMAVLGHWVAADDACRALPHAVHQLYAVHAAGLSTKEQELDMLGLLERASDPVLMNNLWLTAQLDNSDSDDLPAETWHRVRVLRQRVESLPDKTSHAAWIAYEAARDHWLVEGSPSRAYEVLAPAADQMPETGVERAAVEFELATIALGLTGDPRTHLQRARDALVGLPAQPAVNRVRMAIDGLADRFLDPVEGMRSLAARLRASRKRGDLATVADTCVRMGGVHATLGCAPQALRHYKRAARLHAGGANEAERFQTPFVVGKVAMNAGHYALSHRLLTMGDDCVSQSQRPVHLAVLHLRLGDTRQAELHMSEVTREALSGYFWVQAAYIPARAQLDRLAGRDPLPALREQLSLAHEFGLSGVNLDLLAWEVDRLAQPVAERLKRGDALLGELRRTGTAGAKLGKALLEIAEVRAEADATSALPLAAEASRLFRRGCANPTVYLPDCLVRCARLIRHHDPREADTLMHVARRWVHNALQHLPPGAQHGFVSNVAVNRLLLNEVR